MAGGQSRRMGQDKARVELGGKRLIDHVIERLTQQCEHVVISGGSNYETGFQFLPDRPSGPKGPVSALWAALQAWDAGAIKGDGIFTVPVDAPFAPLDLCQRLHGASSAIAAAPDGTHQTFAWWVFQDLQEVFAVIDPLKSVSLRYIGSKCGARMEYWDNARGFINLNSPGDVLAVSVRRQD